MNKESFIKKKSLDVVGIGNAIVDILIHASEDTLTKQSLIKGSMTLINESDAEELYKNETSILKTSGGSAANTIAGISQLGGNTGFIGRIKKDRLGEIFKKDICSSGAKFNTPAINYGPSTARCFIFVTPDAQRTMCTFLGASVFLEPADLDLSLIKESKVLYLEGYLWDNSHAKKAFLAASAECKKSGGKVALSLSDFLCIQRHRDSFINLVENHIDILFSNESEIISLYNSPSLNSAIDKVRGKCELAVITIGEKGSIIVTEEDLITINPYNLGDAIDTTGAGDLYASGFLYGFTSGRDIRTCGQIASICAGHIVTILGSRTQTSLKSLVEKNLLKRI